MNDYTDLKRRLEAEKEDLEKELGEHGHIIDNETGDWVAVIEPQDRSEEDDTVEADRMAEYQVDVAVVTLLEQKYDQVKKALKRIEDGTYGICEVSGEPIPIERLNANPTASTTVEHATPNQ